MTNACVKISVARVAKVVWKICNTNVSREKMGCTLQHNILIVLRSGMHISTLRHIIFIVLRFIPLVLKDKSFQRGRDVFQTVQK